jgi:septal ring factor EnvC (AmiA/AmiB activator)
MKIIPTIHIIVSTIIFPLAALLRSWVKSLPCSSILILIFLVIIPVTFAHGADWKTEKKNIEEKIKSQSISVYQLQEGLRKQQEQAQENIAQERDLLAELEILNATFLKQSAKLAELENSLAAQQVMIATRENEIIPIQAERQKILTHMQKRITAYYKTGKIGMLNVAFSVQTLPELLSIHDAFSALLQYDQNLLGQYRETLAELERNKKALILEKDLLATFITQASQEKEALEKTSQEKNELLEQIRTQTKLHEQAAREIEKAADDLSAQLSVMRQKKELYSQGFLINKGKLSPPVKGKILTLYGQPGKNKLGVEEISNGITIDAPHGTKVKAIFEGTVNYAGYLHGYGNTIIIDHGFDYSTVISRIETLLKKEGDAVKTGEDIGIMGETATLVEEGLYVEIRHGDETEDPLLWLDKNKLSIP